MHKHTETIHTMCSQAAIALLMIQANAHQPKKGSHSASAQPDPLQPLAAHASLA